MELTTEKNIEETNYKKIQIQLADSIKLKDFSIVKKLFTQFNKKEITYSISENNLILFLNNIDFNLFKKTVSLIKSNSLTENINSLLDEIVNKIDSIKSYGLKGKKRKYIDYNKERKVKGRKEKVINRNQYYYAKNNNFIKTNNVMPEEYIDKIICGNSEMILKNLPENSVDLIFTSPPYNFGLDYEANDDAHYWENYFNKLYSIFDECIRVLKYGGRIIVNIQPLFSDYIPSHHLISNYFISKKLI